MKFKEGFLGITMLLVSTGAMCEEKYYLAEDEPTVGSHIHQVIATSNIPFSKSYFSMTDQQRADFRSAYTGLGPHDEPPFPRDGMASIITDVSKSGQLLREGNAIRAVALVDSTGSVQKVTFYEITGDTMARIVTSTLLDAPFKPGLCAGTACEMEFPFMIHLVRRTSAVAISRPSRHCASLASCPPG